MKVLVVGASGKYAGFVVPELIKRGATVTSITAMSPRPRQSP
jgi:uncharacterized protein YbjT (DUF2867 family)